MKSCVKLYLELAPGAVLQPATTPFLPEDHRDSPARGPACTGPVEECPWCCHTFSPNPYSSVSELEKAKKARRHRAGPLAGASDGPDAAGPLAGGTAVKEESKGRLAPVAAKILMKILYGARMARLDLLRAVSHLACYFTKWSTKCDQRLH